jgi:hypothetical protein
MFYPISLQITRKTIYCQVHDGHLSVLNAVFAAEQKLN